MVVMVGLDGVGKTSLLNRLHQREFAKGVLPETIPTIGATLFNVHLIARLAEFRIQEITSKLYPPAAGIASRSGTLAVWKKSARRGEAVSENPSCAIFC